MGSSDDKVIRIEQHRARRPRDDDASFQTKQDVFSSLSLAVLSCWPGMAWLPLPFETRDYRRDKR